MTLHRATLNRAHEWNTTNTVYMLTILITFTNMEHGIYIGSVSVHVSLPVLGFHTFMWCNNCDWEVCGCDKCDNMSGPSSAIPQGSRKTQAVIRSPLYSAWVIISLGFAAKVLHAWTNARPMKCRAMKCRRNLDPFSRLPTTANHLQSYIDSYTSVYTLWVLCDLLTESTVRLQLIEQTVLSLLCTLDLIKT